MKAIKTTVLLSAAIAVALGLSACKKEATTDTAASQPAAAEPQASSAVKAQEATAAALAALTSDELRKRGNDALKEQRLYTPSGDNAMEYFLALRNKSKAEGKADVSAEMALTDLMPYAVNEAFQAVTRSDFAEAERLRSLIEKVDSQAPALQSIQDAVASAKANADKRKVDEEQRLADVEQRKIEEEARKKQLAAEQAAAAANPRPQPAASTPAPAASQPVASTPRPQPSQPAASQPVASTPAPAPAAPAPRASTGLVAISTPSPAYPAEAKRDGTAGEVTLSITIGTDGSVTSTSVVRATPRGVFERGVQSTVKRWKFQPVDSPQTIQRTFSFSP